MITPTNAIKLAVWLAHAHPQAFRMIAAQTQPSFFRFNGFGALRAAPFKRRLGYSLGYLGQDDGSDIPEITVTADAPPDLTPDLSSTPDLTDIGVTDITSSDLTDALSPSSPENASTGGFWSSLASSVTGGLSSAASAIGSVAGALVNPTSIKAAGQVASAVIQGQNTQQAARIQSQVLATQLARVQAGYAPAPIQYLPGQSVGGYPLNTAGGSPYGAAPGMGIPYAGSPLGAGPVPAVYNPATGQYSYASPSVLSSLTPSALPGGWLPWALGGGILLALLLARSPSP